MGGICIRIISVLTMPVLRKSVRRQLPATHVADDPGEKAFPPVANWLRRTAVQTDAFIRTKLEIPELVGGNG